MDLVDITAGRLHLRPFGPEDVDAVHAICQDSEIQRWTTVPSPYSRDDAVFFCERLVPDGWRDETGFTWAIRDAATAAVLGAVSLQSIDARQRRADVGFWAAAEARGQGVMTEAVQAVCRWGFATLDIGCVAWFAEAGNVASRRVAEKAGFRIADGVIPGYLEHRGTRVDAWAGTLLAVR